MKYRIAENNIGCCSGQSGRDEEATEVRFPVRLRTTGILREDRGVNERVRRDDLAFLEKKAQDVRSNVIEMVGAAGSGHPGGSLSAVDILVSLYFKVMRVDPNCPDWPDRDRFVLGKGHACPALYAVLAEKGYFGLEELDTLRKLGSRLQGHPDARKTPGVEASTGSLGQGLSIACGMALAGKIDKRSYRVYALLGDGEIQEGQVWEAAMACRHYELDNLTAIIDHNGLQIDGRVKDIMSVDPLGEKWRAFGWHVIDIDGHSFEEILEALFEAEGVKGRPTMIVANTIKGKGVPFMEDDVNWHGTAPNPEQIREALRFLTESAT